MCVNEPVVRDCIAPTHSVPFPGMKRRKVCVREGERGREREGEGASERERERERERDYSGLFER